MFVLVDKPSFLTLFYKVMIINDAKMGCLHSYFQEKDVSGHTDDFNIEFFTFVAYILLVVSVLISFLCCYGAINIRFSKVTCCHDLKICKTRLFGVCHQSISLST